ncbi:hypothetical protein ABK040_016192 [Willaertia magna]
MNKFALLCVLMITQAFLLVFSVADVRDPLVHDEPFLQLLKKHARTWIPGRNKLFEGKTIAHAKKHLGFVLPTTKTRNNISMRPKITKAIMALPDNYNAANDTRYASCTGLHTIRNQLNCGACWAFSISEMVADRFCIKSQGSVNVILSPQWMVSCNSKNSGCDGGEFPEAFQFVESTGLVVDSCDPYVSGVNGKVPDCPSSCSDGSDINKRFRTRNSRMFQKDDLNGMMQSIIENGPLITGFKVYRDFFNYKGGVYRHTAGGLVGGHAVKIVGWGVDTETNLPYWTVANSWGPSWGLNGFFKILRGKDECIIEENMWETTPVV